MPGRRGYFELKVGGDVVRKWLRIKARFYGDSISINFVLICGSIDDDTMLEELTGVPSGPRRASHVASINR